MIKENIGFIMILGLILAFICSFGWLCFCYYQCYESEYTEERKLIENTLIYSLSTNIENRFTGSFFLGSGSIHGDENIYYYFYKKDGNGKRLVNCAAYNTIIMENNNITPHVEYYEIDGTYRSKDGEICTNVPTRIEIILYVPLNTTPLIFSGDI